MPSVITKWGRASQIFEEKWWNILKNKRRQNALSEHAPEESQKHFL